MVMELVLQDVQSGPPTSQGAAGPPTQSSSVLGCSWSSHSILQRPRVQLVLPLSPPASQNELTHLITPQPGPLTTRVSRTNTHTKCQSGSAGRGGVRSRGPSSHPSRDLPERRCPLLPAPAGTVSPPAPPPSPTPEGAAVPRHTAGRRCPGPPGALSSSPAPGPPAPPPADSPRPRSSSYSSAPGPLTPPPVLQPRPRSSSSAPGPLTPPPVLQPGPRSSSPAPGAAGRSQGAGLRGAVRPLPGGDTNSWRNSAAAAASQARRRQATVRVETLLGRCPNTGRERGGVMAGVLVGRVCVVTGASRGIGKGIALQLAEAGATVYITGRNIDTLTETAHEVGGRGGKCVPVVCDSAEEQQVSDLFTRVGREHQGQLDILVNNAYAGVQGILDSQGKRFWEMPPSMWDDINNVGLRGHYLCSVHAARMMVKAGKGLIVVISSMGGLKYIFNVPYGVGKAACDRLAVDCAHELGPHGVAFVSLWPGPVRTETITAQIINAPATSPAQQQVAKMFASGETPEMSGRCIVALATDPDIMRKSGRVHLTCDLATEYGLSDVDGRPLIQFRSLSVLLSQVPGTSWIQRFIPSFIKMPKWMFNLATNKF